MRQTRFALFCIALVTCGQAAATEYTPAQLRSMVACGKLPAQAAPTSQSQAMEFEACIAKVRGVTRAVAENYPTKLIVSTGVLFTMKVWTNDAAMTMTCSQPDGKLVVTSARYT